MIRYALAAAQRMARAMDSVVERNDVAGSIGGNKECRMMHEL